MNDDIDEQLLPIFLEEAQEIVPNIGSDLRDWRANSANEAASLSLRRLLHTLKGSARMAGAISLGELCHLMETRIKEALDQKAFPAELFDDLEQRMDRISLDVERMGASAEEEASAPRAAVPLARRAAMLRMSAETLDRLISEVDEVGKAHSRVEAELRSLKQNLGVEGLSDIGSIRQAVATSIGDCEAALAHQARLVRDVQRELLRVRAVPFSNLSERLHRTVRQTARELGKKAQLEIEGAGVELDRSVFKRIAAPLEHMLRNALAHGIESPEARVAAGKPEAGLIAIALRKESNEIALTLSDDGAGLDLGRLREKGLERGLLPTGRPASDAEIAQLIFHSGLSTADEVSELAGRGVGMDVVRTEITAMGGRVEVATAQGQGSTFTIYWRSPWP